MTRVRLPRSVLDSLGALVTDHDDPKTETGGIVVGHDRGRTIDVTGIGAPGPNAVHEATRFTRDLAHAGDVAAEAWRRDRSQWIGEWHTHPNGRTAPSRHDLRTYTSLVRNPTLRLDRFVALIVTTGRRTAVHAWIVTGSCAHRARIRVDDDRRPDTRPP